MASRCKSGGGGGGDGSPRAHDVARVALNLSWAVDEQSVAGAGVGTLRSGTGNGASDDSADCDGPFCDESEPREALSSRNCSGSNVTASWALVFLGQPAHCPLFIVSAGMSVALVIVIVGVLVLPMSIETNFDSFLKTDVESSIIYDAFSEAKAARKSGTDADARRRLRVKEFVRSGRRLLDAFEKAVLRASTKASDEEEEEEDEDEGDASASAAAVAGVAGDARRDRRLQASVSKDVFLAYELQGSMPYNGFFDIETLVSISNFEKRIRALKGWEELCRRVLEENQPLCKPGFSYVSYAMPTANIVGGRVVPTSLILDGRGSESVPVETALLLTKRHGMADLLLPSDVSALLTGGSETKAILRKMRQIRSAFRFVIPGDEVTDQSTRLGEPPMSVSDRWEAFVSEELIPLLRIGPDGNVKAYFQGSDFATVEVRMALSGDMMLAGASGVFVMAYLLFHTRSILLSLVGLLITFLSVPIAYVFSAVFFGTTTVSFTSFLALFLVVGFGSDVIFVYTDFWRDSAQHFQSYEHRLGFVYQNASRASFATTATTAVSFFANLASVIRALRQFGFFMGLCVMIVWVMISVVYAPLCMLDEQHFAAYHISFSKTPQQLRAEGSNEESRRRKYLDCWARHIHRFKNCWCFVPMILSVIGVGIAASSIQMGTGATQIFPDDHNMNRVSEVMRFFSSEAFPAKFEIPPQTEKVCNEQKFDPQDVETCALYWCESSFDDETDFGESCGCHRRLRTSCSEGFKEESYWEVVQRFVSADELSKSRVEQAAASYLNSARGTMGEEVLFEEGTQPSAKKLSPMLLQEWESGTVNVGYFSEVTTIMKRVNPRESGTNSCGWEDMCFCGSYACPVVGGYWQKIPRVQLPFDDRRLKYVGFKPKVPKSMRARVRIVIGLKVDTSLSLLGDTRGERAWNFLHSLDLSNPWAQRHLYTLCTDFPAKLRVVATWCWMDDFRSWLRFVQKERFPALPHLFEERAMKFGRTARKPTAGDRYIWRYGNQIKAMFFSMSVDVSSEEDPATSLQYKAAWNEYVDAYNAKAVESARGVFHVSKLWVDAETQSALFKSTGHTVLILLALAFMGMMSFTWSIALSFFTVVATGIVMFGLTFFIVVCMNWSVGLIEVIAVIYFVGYAVTYSLHVAHKYASRGAIQEAPSEADFDQDIRYWRTSFALKAIGGAALGSAVTTAGASLFLVFCTLRIFTRLGGMCLVVTLLSIFTALGPLPAMLMVCGPRRVGHCERYRNVCNKENFRARSIVGALFRRRSKGTDWPGRHARE